MRICNRHHHKGRWPKKHFYVGRPGTIAREEVARGAIDATRFGNPFSLVKHGEGALDLYRRHLWDSMKDFPEHVQALVALPPDAVLICSCAPRPCHAELVAKAWEWIFRRRRRCQRLIRLTKWGRVPAAREDHG